METLDKVVYFFIAVSSILLTWCLYLTAATNTLSNRLKALTLQPPVVSNRANDYIGTRKYLIVYVYKLANDKSAYRKYIGSTILLLTREQINNDHINEMVTRGKPEILSFVKSIEPIK